MKHYSDGILELIDKCGDIWELYYNAMCLYNPDTDNATLVEHLRTRAWAMTEALETVTGKLWYYSTTRHCMLEETTKQD